MIGWRMNLGPFFIGCAVILVMLGIGIGIFLI